MTYSKLTILCGGFAVLFLGACSSRPSMAVAAAAVEQSPAPKAAPASTSTSTTTIAELWKGRTALAGKKVTVRGTVTKFNGGILGVNWIHIQDGTGKSEDGSNDLTITSDMVTKVGDAVTVTGVVGVNKDIGSGYFYPVIIEKAVIEKALAANK